MNFKQNWAYVKQKWKQNSVTFSAFQWLIHVEENSIKEACIYLHGLLIDPVPLHTNILQSIRLQ